MGLFDHNSSGNMSPITLGLLGLLAYRTLKGKGRLADILGVNQHVAPGAAPSEVPATEGVGTAGSATGALGGLGGAGGPSAPNTGGVGGLGGLLGGGALATGLRDLLDRFRGTPHEEVAKSWVSTGPNQTIAPQHLEQTLGEERVQWLMEQTGLTRDQLLAGLSQELPQVVDKLTPDGRMPSEAELKRAAGSA